MEALGPRGAELVNMINFENQVRAEYIIPSRGLIGFVSDFLTLTKGYGIIAHTFKEYRPYKEVSYGERVSGVLISMANGQSTAYALEKIEDRGVMFITPGTMVYEGMIVGENSYDTDLTVNPCQTKQLTNMRSASKDHTVVLKKPRLFTLESALDYINSDELVEITPKTFRLRKKILNANERKRHENAKNKDSRN